MKKLYTILGLILTVSTLYAADAKISALTALTTPATGDLLVIVDVSDTTDAASGTTKYITVANMILNDAFDPSWNGVTAKAITPDAVYDKFVTVQADIDTRLTASSTADLTNKTLDAGATGNVLKFLDYKDFVYPARVDGSGCTIVTNSYTDNTWGLATYNGTSDTNANYAIFRLGIVPKDLDTAVAMVLSGFSIRVAGTDTDAAQFTIALFNPTSSAGSLPTDFTGFSTFILFDSGTLTSPASGDIFFFSDVTLTGWAAALTAGEPMYVAVARRNGSNDDAISIEPGTIQYGRTK